MFAKRGQFGAVLCQIVALGLVGGCLAGDETGEAVEPSSPQLGVAGPAAVNLAAGKAATQSSTALGADAARAVDGNPDGDWNAGSVTHTENEAQPWWQVDLGAMSDLGEIVIYNRTDCCSERLADFDVLVSRDGVAWRAVATVAGVAPARAAFPVDAFDRFVRIQLRGNNPLSLAEVQVFAPTDLAAGRTATQSSTAFDGDAARAVDGNTDGDWGAGSVTSTEDEPQAWWQVDLGAVTDLGKVVLYNRTDCCSERLADLQILASIDGVSWSVVGALAGVAGPRTGFAVDTAARFVRVQLRGRNHLSLAEVRVFAARDLAAGQPTRQSSTAFGADAARAVDGNLDGDWNAGSVTSTDAEAQPWWQVDLGAIAPIRTVVIYNRTDCCSDRLADLDVQGSDDGVAWWTMGALPGAAGRRTEIPIDDAARFVRVQLRGTGYLSLAEVEVLAP
jgi:NedA-like, galactose-binding domain